MKSMTQDLRKKSKIAIKAIRDLDKVREDLVEAVLLPEGVFVVRCFDCHVCWPKVDIACGDGIYKQTFSYINCINCESENTEIVRYVTDPVEHEEVWNLYRYPNDGTNPWVMEKWMPEDWAIFNKLRKKER